MFCKVQISQHKVNLTSKLLLSLVFVAGCSSENKKTMQGAGLGAAAGAVVGGIIGHQTGQRDKGALLGAALGAGIGGVAGRRLDKQAKELEKVAETKRTEQGIVSKLKADILFDTGKADVKPAAQTNLSEMAAIMKKYPENILTVKGHTDSVGSDALNAKLSQERADSVKRVLIASGIPATTVTAIGQGESFPVADNSTAAGRQQNRRVEIEITVDESKVPEK